MNLRLYLQLVRPIRSLIIAGVYGFFLPLSWGKLFLHIPYPTGRLVGFVVALPLTIGMLLVGAVHEPMHLPFIRMLPGSARRLRRATAGGILVAAAALTGGAALTAHTVPLLAVFGLAFAVLSLPCTDRHRGGVWPIVLAFALMLFYVLGARRLEPGMVAAPLAFFCGGTVLGSACIVYGFAPRFLAERSAKPFRSIQTAFSSLGRPARGLERTRWQLRLHQRPGRDWTTGAVRGTTWSWMGVVAHETTGCLRGFGACKGSIVLLLILSGYPLLLPLFNLLIGQHLSVQRYWMMLATYGALTRPDPDRIGDVVTFISGAFYPIYAAALAFCFFRPRLAYPISRTQLAQVLFGLVLRQLAIALIVPLAILFAVSLAGQIRTGHYLPGLGFPVLGAVGAALAALVPLLMCVALFVRSFWHLIPAAIFLIAFVVLGVFRESWVRFALTLPGGAVLMLLIGASLALLRWRLRRHYRACDLFDESDSSKGPAALRLFAGHW